MIEGFDYDYLDLCDINSVFIFCLLFCLETYRLIILELVLCIIVSLQFVVASVLPRKCKHFDFLKTV